jgi:GntR family transcriptional regulator
MTILISSQSDEALFEQIKRQVRRAVVSGELPEGAALPSMRQLARDIQVSLITTKRAYEDLEKEGLLVSQAGRGTFVAGQSGHYLREKKLRLVEDRLGQAVDLARELGLERTDFFELAETLWEQGDK